jgi:hypothetical protein
MDNQIRQVLSDAADGLLYPSESDYAFQYVEWNTEGKRLTKKVIRQLASKKENAPVKSRSLDDFFKNVTEIKDWYEEEEKAETQRFRQLKETLQNHLSNIRVFEVGKIEIDAFIIGKTKDGKCAGLSTKVIET